MSQARELQQSNNFPSSSCTDAGDKPLTRLRGGRANVPQHALDCPVQTITIHRGQRRDQKRNMCCSLVLGPTGHMVAVDLGREATFRVVRTS